MNISPNTKPAVRHSSRTWMWAAVAGIWLALFGALYWYMPIANLPIPDADYWNDKATDIITLVASLAAATLGTRLMRHYQPSEPPHRIWLTFALGWWAWFAGEVTGLAYDYYYWFTEFPEFTIMDAFWLLGYFFFGLSLYYQFRLIYRSKSGRKTVLYISFIALVLLITLGLTDWALAVGLGDGASWGGVFVGMLYPVLDVLEGAAALWLFFLFGRGYLGRPWWGLILFAFADSVSTFFWIGGYNWISDPAYYQLDWVSNVIYVGGYLITALAFLAAHEHMERGVISTTSTN